MGRKLLRELILFVTGDDMVAHPNVIQLLDTVEVWFGLGFSGGAATISPKSKYSRLISFTAANAAAVRAPLAFNNGGDGLVSEY